jgi:hypothetical protein
MKVEKTMADVTLFLGYFRMVIRQIIQGLVITFTVKNFQPPAITELITDNRSLITAPISP